uniref:RRM domain-containing protein n=1 Tax=Timema bartmani TaxID=61472 RepID=A0A7R9F0J7_9NEOP|nr:unnamed protein product [Timema bartmani]
MSTERSCEFELPLYPGSIPNESQHNRIMALMNRTGSAVMWWRFEGEIPGLEWGTHAAGGYTITQVNGQRIYGPPPDWTGPPPPKGCEVFVGKLPRGIYEDVIIPLFEQIGRIYQVRLLMDFSGTNRGYCFVHFTSPEDARMAIFKMDGYEICKGRFLGVVKSIDNCRLFVGGVPKTRTKEEITEEISRHVEGVIETILYNSVVNKRINRGFAFVEFESHRAAAVARRKFMTGKYLLWNQTEISVDWAEPEREVDARVMSKVRVLYMRNILLQTSEKRIQSAIEEVVESKMIERIKKMRDFAFIHFADRKSAEAAKIYWHSKYYRPADYLFKLKQNIWNNLSVRNDKRLPRSSYTLMQKVVFYF